MPDRSSAQPPEKPAAFPIKPKADEAAERRAKALRENLLKRKSQARARQPADKPKE